MKEGTRVRPKPEAATFPGDGPLGTVVKSELIETDGNVAVRWDGSKRLAAYEPTALIVVE